MGYPYLNVCLCVFVLSSWVDTLYTFWDSITHYKTESVCFWD